MSAEQAWFRVHETPESYEPLFMVNAGPWPAEGAAAAWVLGLLLVPVFELMASTYRESR